MRVFISSQNVLFLVVAITFVASIYAIIHARTIRISTHTLQGSVSQSHKIAVASDIHADGLTGVSQIKRVVKRISSLNPDLVILPGDLLDGPGKLPSDLLKPFKTINKPIFFSLGNHDQYLPREEVQRVLKDSSIHLLQDEYHIIGELCIVGVSDREDREAVKKYCPRLPNNTYNILSYHRPDGLVDAKSKGVNLMVCGHTHNGQIFPFNLLTKTRFSHINGWYSLGQTMQYVSSGAGTWGPPMRLGSNSEVALINIVPK